MTNRQRILLAGIAVLAVAGVVFRTPLSSILRGDGGGATLVLSGNIEAHESVLSFKTVQSRIVSLPFDEGRWVAKGTVLAEVDASDYRQQLAIAEAGLAVQRRQLDTARQNQLTAGHTLQVDEADLHQRRLDLDRARDLQGKGFLSTANLDQAETAIRQSSAILARDRSQQAAAVRSVAVAEAGVRNAEESTALARIVTDYATLRAPFDGVITVRQAEVGEVVSPGTPVVTLADLDHLWLRAYLNETDLGRVKLGQEVAVGSDSHPGKRYRGRISFIAEKAEFTPKSVETHAERVSLVYRIKVDIDNPQRELVPGMPADVYIDALSRSGFQATARQ